MNEKSLEEVAKVFKCEPFVLESIIVDMKFNKDSYKFK